MRHPATWAGRWGAWRAKEGGLTDDPIGWADASSWARMAAYGEARCDISRQKDAILGFKKRFMGSKGIVTVASHGLKKTASGRF